MDHSFRVCVALTTELVKDISHRQQALPLAQVALARLVTGAVLLAGRLKECQGLGVLVEGDGVLGPMYAESFFDGAVRGYVSNPEAYLEEGVSVEKIGAAVGKGTLQVMHHLPHQKAPHRASVELATGEIGDDVAYFLQQSYQIPSVVALGCVMNENVELTKAGGFLVELMPEAPQEVIPKLESIAAALSMRALLEKAQQAEDLLEPLREQFSLIELPHDITYHHQCKCSQERVERSISLMSEKDIHELMAMNQELETTCEFCRTHYRVSQATLQKILSGKHS
jgi:molecular chaperone Hsp33